MVEGEQTDIKNFLTVDEVLRREFDSKQFSPIELRNFGGNPTYRPELIESVRTKIHFTPCFRDSIHMERLLNILVAKQKGL